MNTETIFILLAVTSSSVVGLMAIWAGLGRGYWFLRVAALGAVVGLALLIPAYELVIVYTIQCLVVVPPLLVARRLRARGEGNHVLQFMLLDLLMLTAVAAVLLGVGMSMPSKVWESDGMLGLIQIFFGAVATPPWVDYFLTGLIAGAVTLLAAWIVLRRQRRWIRWTEFLLCAMLIAALVGAMTCLGFESRMGEAMMAQIPTSTFGMETTSVAVTLILLLPLIPIAAFLALVGVRKGLPQTAIKRRRTAAFLLAIFGFGLLTPPAWMFYRLMTPQPIPNDPLPTPNGYERLLRAGKQLENVTVPENDEFVPETERPTPKDYRDFFTKYFAVVDDARKALDHECRAPLKYDISDIDGMMEMRQLARAMIAQGDAAASEGDTVKASEYYRDTIRLGKASARGGLFLHWLVGVAVEGLGLQAVHERCDSMTPAARRKWIAEIPTLANEFEPAEECLERDGIWDQNACGWQGCLYDVIEKTAGEGSGETMASAEARRQARYRLLLLDLALAEYRSKHGAYPKDLAALAPEVLKEVPVDPFSEKPLVYRLTDKGYVLYSVGDNGVDDGGAQDPANWNAENDDVGFW